MESDRQAHEKTREVREESIQRHRERQRQLEDFNRTFAELASSSEISPQKRGFALESLFFELLAYCEFEFQKPYRVAAGAHIDGHFRYEKFDYLVEAKWTEEPALQRLHHRVEIAPPPLQPLD